MLVGDAATTIVQIDGVNALVGDRLREPLSRAPGPDELAPGFAQGIVGDTVGRFGAA
jgi:hypothetical protein